MKINNIYKRILSLVVVFIMTMSSFSFAQGNVVKEETVYVNLDINGKPIEKTSSIWLHSESPLNKIQDITTLDGIVNVKGDEEPEIKEDKIIWETEEKDIFYQGKTNKNLPIETEVKYYLNNKEMKPEDMAGRSGNIKIKLKLNNKDSYTISKKDGGKKVVYNPLIATAVINLPLDKFKDVKINSGKILSDGSNQIISFATIPGFKKSLNFKKDTIDIPEYLEITATTEDFEMKPIIVTVTSDLPEIRDIENTEDLDELIDGINQIKEASEKLGEGTSSLYEGQTALNNGIKEFTNGLGQINLGAEGLNEGSGELKNGIDSAYKGSLELDKGAKELSKGGKTLGNGTKDWSDGAVEFSEKSMEFANGAKKVADGVSQVPGSTKKMNKGMNELVDGTGQVKEGQDKLTEGLAESLEGLEKIKKGKEKELEVVSLLLGGTDQLINAVESVGKIPGVGKIAEKMLGGLEQQRMALEGLKSSSNEIIGGVAQLEEGLQQAEAGSKELSTNLAKINGGQKEIGAGLNQLAKGTEKLEGASEELRKGSQGLEAGANKLNKNANLLNKGAKQFNQGTGALSQGTNKLSGGLNELSKGAGQLKDGTNELSKGANQLNNGGNELKQGSNELEKGTKELDEGMNKFHEEGIAEISNRIEDRDLDIDEILRTKDELVKISKEYDSFTGKDENMDGSVKFVLKTEGINKVEEKEILDLPEEKSEKKGFIEWIKSKFKGNK